MKKNPKFKRARSPKRIKNQAISFNTQALFWVGLVALSLIIFWQTTSYPLVWDDANIHLTQNPHFNPPSGENVLKFWKDSYADLYIPIAYTGWWLIGIINQAMTGDFFHVFAFHFANILLHSLNGILVFLLLKKLLNDSWEAAVGASLFLVHPLQVESVVWVSEFRGLAAAFFGLLALWLHLQTCEIKYATSHKSLYFNAGVSWLCFACALLAKPSAVVILLFAGIFEVYRYRPGFKQILHPLALWILPVIVISITTAIVQKSAQVYPIWINALVWTNAIGFYLYKLVLPFNLSAAYGWTPEYLQTNWWFYVIWIVPVCFAIVLWYTRKKCPVPLLAYVIFIVGFLPVSGLKSFIFQQWSTVADRYVYLSMLGPSLAIACAMSLLQKKWQWACALGVLLLLSAQTAFVQVPIWKSELALWDHCLQISQRTSKAYFNRGNEYYKRHDYVNAFADMNHAIELNSTDSKAYYTRGVIHFINKQYESALEDLSMAIKLDPTDSKAFKNRGTIYNLRKAYDKALSDFNQAIKLNGRDAMAYVNRAIVHQNLYQYEDAVSDFSLALAIMPDNPQILHLRAVCLFTLHRYAESLADVRHIQKIGGDVQPGLLKALEQFFDM